MLAKNRKEDIRDIKKMERGWLDWIERGKEREKTGEEE